jgi:predicted alpha/beta superfamily hydrolase
MDHKSRHVALISILLLSATTMGAARELSSGPPWTSEVSVPSSYRVKCDSRVNNESYTLFIHIPLTPPPPRGYPVIYVLDGDFLFGIATDISMALGPGRAPVVVAIGHGLLDDVAVLRRYAPRKVKNPSELNIFDVAAAESSLRFHDYTLPVAPAHRAPAWLGLTPDNVGGLDQFLKVLETEIKPRVERLVRIDRTHQALFGHSIAGLAVLRALFTEPRAFQSFVASSPSIWWDGDAILKGESTFALAVRRRTVAPRVLITVGADEPNSPNPPAAFIASLPPDRAAALRAYLAMASRWSGMVSGARQLADRLERLPGAKPYTVRFFAFEHEDHATVVPAALSRGMWFATTQ